MSLNIIKQVRRRHALSQEQLASILGVSFTTINAWENGKRDPSPSSIKKLQDLYEQDSLGVAFPQSRNDGLTRTGSGFISSVINYNGSKDPTPYTHGIGRWYGSLPSFLVSDLVSFARNDLGNPRRALVNFSGSGTAALEFGLAGVECEAIDVNPAAWLFSTVKTGRLRPPSTQSIEKLARAIADSKCIPDHKRVSPSNLLLHSNKWVTEGSRNVMLRAVDSINRLPSSSDQLSFTAALLNIAIDFCQIDKRCTNHYVFKSNCIAPHSFVTAFEAESRKIQSKLIQLRDHPTFKSAKVSIQDNRNTNFPDSCFDLVFSHPPYGTMINYYSMSRVHLSILELLDHPSIRKINPTGELLRHTQLADQSSSTQAAFGESIAKWVAESHRTLAGGGHLMVVVGDGRDRGYLHHPHTEIIHQAERLGMRLKELFIWVTQNKSGMHVKRKAHHIDHNYILVMQKRPT